MDAFVECYAGIVGPTEGRMFLRLIRRIYRKIPMLVAQPAAILTPTPRPFGLANMASGLASQPANWGLPRQPRSALTPPFGLASQPASRAGQPAKMGGQPANQGGKTHPPPPKFWLCG